MRRPSVKILVALFLLVFAGRALATLPLDFVLTKALTGQRNIYYTNATGTIWQGEIGRLIVNDLDLGRMRLSTDFWPLLVGRVHLAWQSDAARASSAGQLAFGFFARKATLTDTSLRLDLPQSGIITPFPVRGRVLLRVSDLALQWQGCERADGTFSTDILTGSFDEAGWQGPPLDGVLRCDDRARLVLSGAGGSQAESISIDANLARDGEYSWSVDVASGNDQLALMLPALGFAIADDSRYRLLQTGKIPGL